MTSKTKTGERLSRMKTARITKSIVPEEYNNTRIDRYLAERFSYQSRTRWQKEIEDGLIACNGIKLNNYHKKIKSGDSIEYTADQREEPPVRDDFSILYEDDYFIACNKPGNLPVHPSGRFFNNTLLFMLQEKNNEKLFPLHRLDRETSGTVLFAKSKETASTTLITFPEAVKKYTAIVHGKPIDTEFTIDIPIGNDSKSMVRKKRSAQINADETAITHFKTIESFDQYSVITARLETGRLHQIRVHLLYANLPILGDKLYGLDEKYYLRFIEEGNSPELIKKIGFHRTALHAHSLKFFHPNLKKNITIEAPLPDDMKSIVKGNYEMSQYFD